MQLREQIDEILPSDADLEAFCIDHFPDIQIRFSGNMERKYKVNLLIQLAGHEKIASILESASRESGEATFNQQSRHSARRSRWTFVLTGIGMLLLPLSALGASLTVSNYRKLFLSIGTLGGIYLLFGLFFANISMFPPRQRARVLGFLIAGLIIITCILGAQAASYYYRSQKENSLAGQSGIASLDMNCSVISFPEWSDLRNSPSDLSHTNKADLFRYQETLLSSNEPLSKPAQIRPLDMKKTVPIRSVDLGLPIFGQEEEEETEKEISVPDLSAGFKNPKAMPKTFTGYELISGPDIPLSPSFKNAHRGEIVEGVYKICVASNGAVFKVEVVRSIEGEDDRLVANIMKNWRYKTGPFLICHDQIFKYNIE